MYALPLKKLASLKATLARSYHRPTNWLRGDIKYYFADFVRKGGTPPLTEKKIRQKKVTDLGGTPLYGQEEGVTDFGGTPSPPSSTKSAK